MPSSLRRTVLAACVLAVGGAAADAPRAGGPPAPGRWHTITLPVTAERLCDAVDLPAPALAENLLFDLVRVLHERPLRRDDFARGRARPALELLLGAPASAEVDDRATSVPLPLAPETWANVILKRRVDAQALAGAILSDRRASLLYVGLSQLDADTLAAIERLPAVLYSLDERQASAFAAFGGSLVIDGDGVRLPGPPELAPAWAALAGAPHSDPARFVPALLARDRGRLAYFFDAITRLDEAHRRFALGGASGDAAALASLYEIFRRVSPEWDVSLFPFYRPSFDPVTMLATLHVDDDGRLATSWPRETWEQAFSGRATATAESAPDGSNGGAVDAAWLVGAVLADGPKVAPTRAAEIAFAGRVFGGAGDASDPSLAAAIAGYGRYPALMATLEALGVTRPTAYVDAARVAAALTRRGSPTALSSFQAALALVARSARARSLDQPDAARLAASLVALDPQADGYETRVESWLSTVLLTALAEATGAGDEDGAETIVLRGLAGVRAPDRADPAPRIDWYGRRYAVDAAAGALARFPQIRRRQGRPTLDEALALGSAIDTLDGDGGRRARIDALAARLKDLVGALPDIDQNRALRQALDRAHARLVAAAAARAIGADAQRDLAGARAAVIADALTALAYVPALGDPNGPARLGGHVSRRHVFAPSPDLIGDGAEPAWRLPREAVTEDRGWHVEGSLLGLEAALAHLALRRLDVDVIPVAPRLDEAARRQFLLDAALTRPFDWSDADRDLIAEGLATGRAQVRRLSEDPGALEGIAAAIGLAARRTQATAWALAEIGADPTRRFSLAELLRLGAGGRLPFEAAPVPSGCCPRGVAGCPREASDLTLRLAEELAARRLPAALLPGLLSTATQDFVDQVQPLYPGDLEALWTWVAEQPAQRFDDYVAALEGSGALRPVTGSGAEGGRWREPDF